MPFLETMTDHDVLSILKGSLISSIEELEHCAGIFACRKNYDPLWSIEKRNSLNIQLDEINARLKELEATDEND